MTGDFFGMLLHARPLSGFSRDQDPTETSTKNLKQEETAI
jgi:hypothetical protein